MKQIKDYAKSKLGLKYDEVFCQNFLFRAHQVARRGKRGKNDVIKFEIDLSRQLARTFTALKKRKYKISLYKKFIIYEPKKREIQALSFRDRVVLHALCDNFIVPEFEKRLIYDNCACRQRKGAHFGLYRACTFLRRFYANHGHQGYILKCDITKYFQSINHDVLKSMLGWIKDCDIKNFIFQIIDSYESSPNTGLPMGNQTSQWFALLYLNPLDRMIKEKFGIKYYIRYMDDIILIDKDKKKLKDLLLKMKELIENKLKLTFNKKTQIFPIKNGCEFLGYKIYLTKSGKVIRRIKKQTKQRFRNRIKFYVKQYNNKVLEFEDFKNPLRCCISHLKHGHCYGLIKSNLRKLVLLQGNRHENKGCYRKEFRYRI